MKIETNTAILTLLWICLCFNTTVLAAQTAGRVQELKGNAWARETGAQFRKLAIGAPIYTGDQIKTEKNSSLKLRFSDGTRFELGADAAMDVGNYVFQEAGKEESFSARMVKGTFRFFSGLIAKKKPKAMSVGFSVGTIGIRGTHVVGEVNGNSGTIILMEPEDKSRETAIEVSNKFGSVVINQPGYGTEIPDAHSPPSVPRRMRLRTINNMIRSMQTIQRISVPRMH